MSDSKQRRHLLVMVLYAPHEGESLVRNLIVEKIAVYNSLRACEEAAKKISGFDPISAKFFYIDVEETKQIFA